MNLFFVALRQLSDLNVRPTGHGKILCELKKCMRGGERAFE